MKKTLPDNNRHHYSPSRLHIIFGMVLFVALALIVMFVNRHQKNEALNAAKNSAHLILARNLATHKYFSQHLKPSVFEITEDVHSDDFFDPRWMSSTYAIREIDELYKNDDPSHQNYYYKEAAINARSKFNEADEIEREFLRELNENEDVMMHSEVRSIDGELFYVVMYRGEITDESCMMCHRTPETAPADLVKLYDPERAFNRKVGRTVSALSIRVPLSEAYNRVNRLTYELSITLGVIFLGSFAVLFVFASRLKNSNAILGREITERKRVEEELDRKSHALGERVKELNCLYGISEIVERPGQSLEEICKAIVDIMPPSWQYPEITCARISLGALSFTSDNFSETPWRMSSEILLDGAVMGSVEVFYLEEMPASDEGPFLKEERYLIDTISERVSRITDRMRTDEALMNTLDKKDLLMKEIHDRVINNLIVLQGLLKLQAVKVRDDEARELFDESENRIRAMSMIHEALYRTEDFRSIDASQYIRKLADKLFDSYRIGPSRIGLNIDVPSAVIDIDTMIPCGLIVNELVSNSLKHAFPDNMEGELFIGLYKTINDEFTLIVKDNGIGMPADLDIYKTVSLGMQIVTGLIKQIKGSLDVSREGGTEFKITFTHKNFRK
jgi:two-component sensor histidine kinase